jgi:hypothetical protein
MGLTRENEQRLERAGLIAHYNANQAAWQANAQDAYDYTKKAFAGQTVRPDDVAKALRAAVEIDVPLRAVLDKKKLAQKYWIDFFTALVLDRTWAALNK